MADHDSHRSGARERRITKRRRLSGHAGIKVDRRAPPDRPGAPSGERGRRTSDAHDQPDRRSEKERRKPKG